nr:hypothetical protein [Desulfotalea psychrophila]
MTTVIPGNDDAIRSIRLICNEIAEVVLASQAERDGDEASEEAIAAAMGDTVSEMAEKTEEA